MIPRSEHPRPDFCRDSWVCLNGLWEFSIGTPVYDTHILVPFSPEAKCSGVWNKDIGNREFWYRRQVSVPEQMKGKLLLLHFGAVDYLAEVYIDGQLAATHEGGQTGFFADITALVGTRESFTLEVRALDDPLDFELPRGKQYWKPESESIFYTRNSGIWQSVWLEAVDPCHLQEAELIPDLDGCCVALRYRLSQAAELEIALTFHGQAVLTQTVTGQQSGACTLSLNRCVPGAWNIAEDLTWSPENPRLFDVTFTVRQDGRVTDEVRSYFGLRKIHTENGRVYLNNLPCFQKLVLDQGYWPDGLLTAPSDEDYIRDILAVKAMGFNGVRLHQKIEDPRFFYHADRLGLLVWAECAAAYRFSPLAIQRSTTQWMENIRQNRNHPCIIAWTPLNESWGVAQIRFDPEQQAFSQALCALTKALDSTRLVIDNDGWEHVGGDLLTIHDYRPQEEILREQYRSREAALSVHPGGRALFAQGFGYEGQPILVTEFGGIAYGPMSGRDWGYSVAESEEDFLRRLGAVFRPLLSSPVVTGYCYTQLTDVEQEINGLLYYDRTPKAPLEEIAALQI